MDKIYETVKLAVYAFFAWLQIDIEVFKILMIFMLVDSILGAIKAIRIGYKFNFKALLWGFTAKLFFLIIPLLVALLGLGLKYDLTIGVDIVMKVLTVSEAYSVFGNIYSIKNKKDVRRLDVISMLLKSMRIALKKFLNKLLKTIENWGGCEIDKEH